MYARVTPADQALGFALPRTHAVPFVTGEDTGGVFEALELTLEPGAASPPHTLSADKVFYVAQGRLTVDLDGAAHEIGSGAVVHVPAGTVHRYRATDDTPARLLVLVAGATQVPFLRGMGALAAGGPPDPAAVAEHAAAHGVSIMAPGAG